MSITVLARSAALAAGIVVTLAPAAMAGSRPEGPRFQENPDGTIVYGDVTFETWGAFVASDLFRRHGLRCGTPADLGAGLGGGLDGGGPGDCSLSRTDPLEIYDPSQVTYRIPVVVHVLRHGNGVTGHLSVEQVESQIEILNEDFLAILGTLGENGTNAEVQFYLATEDPQGDPTDGITYSNNTEWFNDRGDYWESLAWDTYRYLNIYTNTSGGALGYVPGLPQNGLVGQDYDRVVCYYRAFGRDSGYPPYHQGRTATHEVGHYLGLLHTFSGGCGSSSCYTTADLVCDTEQQSNPEWGCPVGGQSCGGPNPTHNYMNYTDDLCMEEFTPEQSRRLRCTLEHWRPDLYEIVTSSCPGDVDESGTVGFDDLNAILAAWGPCPGCPEDVTGDGNVGFPDVLLVLGAWGPCE